MKKCTHIHIDSQKRVHYHQNILKEPENCPTYKKHKAPRVPPFPISFRNESDTSVYFTPTSLYELPKSSKNKRRHQNKVDIYIAERKKLPNPNEHDTCAIMNEIALMPLRLRDSYSNEEDQSRSNNPHDESKNAPCCRPTRLVEAVQLGRKQKPIECCEEIGFTCDTHKNISTRCKEHDNYSPPVQIKTIEIGLQTKPAQLNRKCQVDLQTMVKVKRCDRTQQTQYLLMHNKECQVDNVRQAHAQTSPFNLSEESGDDNKVSRDRVIIENLACAGDKKVDHIRTSCDHAFPFVGESPSGNLKVPPHMVAYENKKMGILVACPSTVRLHHQEWQEFDCRSEPPRSCRAKNRKRDRRPLESHKRHDDLRLTRLYPQARERPNKQSHYVSESQTQTYQTRLKSSPKVIMQPDPSIQKLYYQVGGYGGNLYRTLQQHQPKDESLEQLRAIPARSYSDGPFQVEPVLFQQPDKQSSSFVRNQHSQAPPSSIENPFSLMVESPFSTEKVVKEWKWLNLNLSVPPPQNQNPSLQQRKYSTDSPKEEEMQNDMNSQQKILISQEHQSEIKSNADKPPRYQLPLKPGPSSSVGKQQSDVTTGTETIRRNREWQSSERHLPPQQSSSAESSHGITLTSQDSGEYLNAEEHQNEIKAATTIQRFVRGYLTRRHVEKMRHAAKVIVNALRSYRKQHPEDYRPNQIQTLMTMQPTEPKSKTLTTSAYLQKGLNIKKEGVLVLGGSDPNQPIASAIGAGADNTGMDIFTYMVNSFTWTLVGTLAEPRTHFGTARIGDEVYIIGGTDPRYKNAMDRNVIVSSVWKMDLQSGEWHLDPDYPKDLDTPRSHFGCVVKSGLIYIFGGNDVEAKALSTCLKYDPKTNGWDTITPMDGPRVSMGAVVHDDRIWIAGGITKNAQNPVLKSVISYDTVTNSWTSIQSLPLSRAFAPLVTAHGKVYVVGGAGPRNEKSTKQVSVPEVLVYDSSGNIWREVGDLDTARHGHAAVVLGHKIVVIGGVSSEEMGCLRGVEVFDLSTSHSHRGRSLHQNLSGMAALALDSP